MFDFDKDAVRRVLAGNYSSLYLAFVWDKTPQGQRFWETFADGEALTPEARAYLQSLLRLKGFALLDRERLREISSKGGKSTPAEKRGFAKNRALASAAGRKGGLSVPAEKRSFSCDRELAAACGRKGGKAAAKAKGKSNAPS